MQYKTMQHRLILSPAWHHRGVPLRSPFMDLTALQTKTRHLWQEFHKLNECYVPEEEAFLAEIQHYGDPQQPQTWNTAWTSLYAKFLADGCLDDSQFLIEFYLVQAANQEGWWDLMPQLLEKLAEIPNALKTLLRGFTKIYQYGPEYDTEPAEIDQVRGLLHELIETRQVATGEAERLVLAGTAG